MPALNKRKKEGKKERKKERRKEGRKGGEGENDLKSPPAAAAAEKRHHLMFHGHTIGIAPELTTCMHRMLGAEKNLELGI